MYRNTPPTIHLKDYRPPEFLIDQVDLRFELDPDTTQVEATLAIRRNPGATRGDGNLRLDGEQLELDYLAIDDRPLTRSEYRVEPEALVLRRVPDRFQLVTRVRIHPARNTALEGLYQSGSMLCTQCEAEGFRRITYFLDRPDVMARFRTTLIADHERFPILLANGNPGPCQDLGDGRHLARWDDPFPKPCYLFALVAGDLHQVEDCFTTASGREVSLRLFVEPEHHDQCEHAMRSLKKAMRWDEDRYGREYDLDVYLIVAVSHFNMGAMENKGLNIFNAKYVLARPDTATDQDFLGIEGVIAHEYFHNWTGNRITCRDWFQLSLKEGFTVFRDQEFSADMGSRDVTRIADVRNLRNRQFPEDAGPLAHPVRPDAYIEINNFYTATVYEKGAELVRMLATLVGPAAFRRGTDLYFSRHDGQAVTIEDFIACIAEVSGRDLGPFLRWYAQPGTPELEIRDHWEDQTGTYTLTIRQRIPAAPDRPGSGPLPIPIAVGLLDPSGLDLPVHLADEPAPAPAGTRVLELHTDEATFRFVGLAACPVPSLLRGFSAPVKVRYDYSDQDLVFLMTHDSDGFNRWDAAQTLAQRLLLECVSEPDRPPPSGFIDAFCCTLTDEDADPGLRAEILTLPSEAYLGDQMETVDVEGIHRARETLIGQIATTLRAELFATYRTNQDPGPYRLSPLAIGRRALKNQAIAYLMHTRDDETLALCHAQFAANQNMTDVMAALRWLVEAGGEVADQALDAFYRRWCDDALVVDKWFAIQALSQRKDTLLRVESLLDHEAFTMTNPNRLRSLVGTFCLMNQVRFHAASGAGYVFLVDRVLELDPKNPQIAARLVQALAQWRRFDEARRGLMHGQLERLFHTQDLSKDVYEVVARTLGNSRPEE